jgi:hypothetical protein
MIILTRKYDGPSIEAFIKYQNPFWKEKWKFIIEKSFIDDARTWWESLDRDKMKGIYNGEMEKLILYK